MEKISLLADPKTNPVTKGGTVVFGVRLDEAPVSDVTVSFSSSNGYVTFSSSLIFTTLNYKTPQSFTITGVSDGIVEGKKTETIILTPSGGGYSRILSFSLNVCDTGCDSQFVSGYNWISGKYSITMSSSSDIAAKRAYMIGYVFNGNGLPTASVPDAITTGFTGTINQTTTGALVGASSTNRLRWDFTDGQGYVWSSYTYHILNATPNGKCVTVSGGHSSESNHIDCLNALLGQGFDIFYVALPCTFQNTETNPNIVGTGTSAHNDFLTGGLDSVTFNALEIFFFEKIRNLNYADANYSYTEHYVTGCSGGGWTTMMLMALDTRFKRGVPMRGVKSILFRAFTDESSPSGWDFEQGPPAGLASRIDTFYQTCTYFDIMLLAISGGRTCHYTHHYNDSCCHYKYTYNLYKSWLQSLATSFGGTYNLTIITDSNYSGHGFRTPDINIALALFA